MLEGEEIRGGDKGLNGEDVLAGQLGASDGGASLHFSLWFSLDPP